jgi:ABC-type transport system involved in cytochrome bd biosynthesis fused ATPase/permease subunit
MRLFYIVLPVLAILVRALPVHAQSVQEIPNAMSAHTVFIIVITAAFLTWAASFSLYALKERTNKQKERQILGTLREKILDELAEVETAREAGAISEGRYKNRFKTLRGDLSRVIDKLRTLAPVKKKHARG